MATAYSLVGVMVGGGLIVASAIVGVLWLVVAGTRPELMRRDRDGEG